MKKTVEVDFAMDGIIEVEGEFYVNQKTYDDVWHIYSDLCKKTEILYEKLIELGINADDLLEKQFDKK